MGQTLKYAALALVTFLAVAAIADVIVNYQYPQVGEVEGANLAMYIDNAFYPNGTAVQWGEPYVDRANITHYMCEAGTVQSFNNLTVVNTGNMNLTVSITTTGLPSGWVLEWLGNNTLLEPDWKVEAALNLTIPTTATTWPVWSFSLNGNA